jgi:hypothetical protein
MSTNPRNKDLKPSHVGYQVCFGLLCMGIGLWFGLPPVLKEQRLRSSGKMTTATITNITLSQGGRGLNRIRYEYQVNAARNTTEDTVLHSYAAKRQVGEDIPITYLPDTPNVSRTEASTEYRGSLLWIVLAIFSALTAIGSVISYFYRKSRR